MKEIICAGFGGQGVLTAGYLLANIGIKANKEVTWIPSYGTEMRGGTANCAVKISDEPISSPFVKKSDILIVMNEPSLLKFQPNLKSSGTLIVNSSIIKNAKYREDVKVFEVPANEIALGNLNPKGANIVMIGALAAVTDLFDNDVYVKGIEEFFAKKNIKSEKNIAVFEDGYKMVKGRCTK